MYVEKGYDAEKIKEMRNDEYTQGIVDELQNEMFDLMANKMDELPKLMQQALNYISISFGSKSLPIETMVNIP